MAMEEPARTAAHTSESVLTFKARALFFLGFLLLLSILGVVLMTASQDRIQATSLQISRELVPTGRLFEQAENEIDVQIHELALLSSQNPQQAVRAQDLGLLRLGPAVKGLLSLHASPELPGVLRPLFEPWVNSAESYQDDVHTFTRLSEAVARLKDLRQKTGLLHRAIERKVTIELLSLSELSREHLLLWTSAFGLGMCLTILFFYLLWRWMRPLERMRLWFEKSAALSASDGELERLPPPSVRGRGLLAPPAEVQSLVEALRYFVSRLQDQSRELRSRSQQIQESEKAMGTLFSALQHFIRHNDELVQELIKKERLASMGEMAARLAHEIRNPLNSLNLKLELLREDLSEEKQKQLDGVLGEIDRLDALTESHLRTTRSRLTNLPEDSELLPVTESALATLEPEIVGAGIEVVTTHHIYGPLRVPIPPNILKAALINLLKNAKEALQSVPRERRRLKIEAISSPTLGWRLGIYDSGCGFPDGFLKEPIESFRTTKPEGSGLGLATTVKMLDAYQVKLSIESPWKLGPQNEGYRTAVFLEGPLPVLLKEGSPSA